MKKGKERKGRRRKAAEHLTTLPHQKQDKILKDIDFFFVGFRCP